MSDSIIVAIVTGLLAFAGTVLTVWGTLRKSAKEAATQREKNAADQKAQNDLILYRLEELEKKQDKHNQLIERVYRLEEDSKVQEEKIKVANHRIEDIERKIA